MVRTRFAPSPTGYLHVGGVRTALFNWLYTRRHGGQFILRIDDTDAQRNLEGALAPILAGFRWLGLDWDEGPEVGGPHGPYFQSQRLHRYQEAVERLLAGGFAYRDYATPEELEAERNAAQAEKRPYLYSRRWMAETPDQQRRFEAEGRSGVVRLRMPRQGQLVLHDHVRGDVTFDWAREQDHVIQRANGTCLYHLASVVDDYDFEITHVIRSEEHLSNTPRQAFLAQSLGYPLPEYAHLPYVAAPGGKSKLSKRKLKDYLKQRDFAQVAEHGLKIAQRLGLASEADTFNPVIVDFYQQVGYLPQAVLNYLLLLGWSLDDRTEFLTLQQMIDNFSLERVNKASASFDPKKLWSFQDHYMSQLPVQRKVEMMLPFVREAGLLARGRRTIDDSEARRIVARVVQASGDRLKTAGDILAYGDFFFDDDYAFDAEAVAKRLEKPGVWEMLGRFFGQLAERLTWDAAGLEQALTGFAAREGLGVGDVVHPVRVVISGKSVGPGLYDCLEILGREECLRRFERAKAMLPQVSP